MKYLLSLIVLVVVGCSENKTDKIEKEILNLQTQFDSLYSIEIDYQYKANINLRNDSFYYYIDKCDDISNKMKGIYNRQVLLLNTLKNDQ